MLPLEDFQSQSREQVAEEQIVDWLAKKTKNSSE